VAAPYSIPLVCIETLQSHFTIEPFLLLPPLMARDTALAARGPGFLARPLVRRTLLMRGSATLTRNFALLVRVH
jgi:hypothetical protein